MTKIEWADKSWNPVTGCTKVSAGCTNCYAERLFPKVYGRQWIFRDGLYEDAHRGEGGKWRPRRFTDVRMHPDRLDAPLHWRKPRRVFVNSMSDLFHEDVPAQFIGEVFRTMSRAKEHTFQILTKRAERMRQLLSSPSWLRAEFGRDVWCEMSPNELHPNVWLGVSVEDQKTADERIPLLLQTPAAVRFVSYEPSLGPVDFSRWLFDSGDDGEPAPRNNPGLSWCIAGGESGPKARPSHPEWFRSVRDQCVEAGVPYFFKQWGEWAPDPPSMTRKRTSCVVAPQGGMVRIAEDLPPLGSACVYWVGKKAAGRELDGRIWDEFPEAVHA